ncbi:MAG: filamentous hemagglutinin N-terminal domain-containing protein, partial [Gammaproteobacteria bacterium]
MNRAYRHIWSAARGAYVIAPETARGHGKSGRAQRAVRTPALVASLVLAGAATAAAPPPATTVVPVEGKANAYISANGVPVVNINGANAAGVSHNQFTRYDVEAKGLVLNNSSFMNAPVVQSKLAGQLVGNLNLGTEAKVIVNEVVSTNRSTLAGYTEVAGGKADVIVANPYGITCDGCGFINSDRVTLTTGIPGWGADGSFNGVNVTRGDILVKGAGLNASAQQILDLVTRAVRIDGQINTAEGGSLGLYAGPHQWSYASREVTGKLDGADAKPEYAIDSTALGGMYAGRIRLIATEAGVGVRMLGDAAASVDDFRLDAAGKVVLQSRVAAGRDIQVAQAGNGAIEMTGAGASLTAAKDIKLQAAGALAFNEGLLKAGGKLAVTGASLTDTSGSAATRTAGTDV